MVLRSATSLRGALEGVGPENRDFFGPCNGTSEASAIWAQKSCDNRYINSYFIITMNGTFYIINAFSNKNIVRHYVSGTGFLIVL